MAQTESLAHVWEDITALAYPPRIYRKKSDTTIPQGTVQRMKALILAHQRVQRERLQAIEDDLDQRTRLEHLREKNKNNDRDDTNIDDYTSRTNKPPKRPHPRKGSKRWKTLPRFVQPPSIADSSSMLQGQFSDLSTGSNRSKSISQQTPTLSSSVPELPATDNTTTTSIPIAHSSPEFLSVSKKQLTASALQKKISPRKAVKPSTPSNTPMFEPTQLEDSPPYLQSCTPITHKAFLSPPSMPTDFRTRGKTPTPSNTPLLTSETPQLPVWPSTTVALSSPTKSTNSYAVPIANLSPSKAIPEELSISTPNNTPMLIPTPFVVPPTTTSVTSYVHSQAGLSTAPFATVKAGFKVQQPITPNNTPMISSSSMQPRNELISPSPLSLPRHSLRSPPALPLNSPSSRASDRNLQEEFSMTATSDATTIATTPFATQLIPPEATYDSCTVSTSSASIVTPQKLSFPISTAPTTFSPNLKPTHTPPNDNTSSSTDNTTTTPLASRWGKGSPKVTPPAKTPMFAPPVTISKRRALLNSLASPSLTSPPASSHLYSTARKKLIPAHPVSQLKNTANKHDNDHENNNDNRNLAAELDETAPNAGSSVTTATPHVRTLSASTERIAWLETSVTRLKTQRELETSLLRHQHTVELEKANNQIERLKVETGELRRRLHDFEQKDVEIRKLTLALTRLQTQYGLLFEEHQKTEQARVQRLARRQSRGQRTRQRGTFDVE